MASALTTRSIAKIFLGIPSSDTGSDALIDQLIPQACQTIEKYCKRIFASATYTEYYDGRGRRDLVLRQRPVTSITSVNLDQGGYYGQGTGAFAASTLLTSGDDYVLVYDDSGKSNAGLLRRIGALGSGSQAGWQQDVWLAGPLAARSLPAWPAGTGNIKVVYVAGYATIPEDLQAAANQLVAWFKNYGPKGAMLASESQGAYSYALMQGVAELGSVRQILSRYREFSIG